MATENYCAIPFTLLNGGKRFQSRDLRLLPLFPLDAQEPRLLERLPPPFPVADQEPRLLGLLPPPLFPSESTSTALVVGGQPVNMRLPTGVKTVAENTTNHTKLLPTEEINIGQVETSQSRSSFFSGRIIEKRPLEILEPMSTRLEHVDRRQLEKDNLANKSSPGSREHVSQRLPLSSIPLKKRRLAIHEPSPSLSGQGSRPDEKTVKRKPPATRAAIPELLPSRQGSTRGGGSIMPLASRDPTLEHGNPIPLTGGESGGKSVLPVEMTTFVGQRTYNTRSSVRIEARPRGWPIDPRQSKGGDVELGPVNIETFAGQQDLSTRPSVSSSGTTTARPLPNRRDPVGQEGGRINSSTYKGVSRYKRTKRWEANVWHDGKQTYMGAYATEIQAARAYDRALIHFRGEETQLSFNLDDYRAELTQLSNIRSEDLVIILRKQSKGPGKPMPDYTYTTRRT